MDAYSHHCVRVSNLCQVRLGDVNQAYSAVRGSLVAGGAGAARHIHLRQVCYLETDKITSARKGAHHAQPVQKELRRLTRRRGEE